MQKVYNASKYHFEWSADGWYKWDRKAAHSAALKNRNAQAKAWVSEGKQVRKWVLPNQLMTMGGIGTGKPEINLWVNAYGVTVLD